MFLPVWEVYNPARTLEETSRSDSIKWNWDLIRILEF